MLDILENPFQTIRRIYSILATKALEDPDLVPIVAGAVEFVKRLTKDMDQVDDDIKPNVRKLYVLSSTAFSFMSTSGSVVSLEIDGEELDTLVTPPEFLSRDREQYANKLGSLDPALEKTYRGAWESFVGGKSDPLRGSLFLMRQAFDHLFELLAPDEEVRQSPYFEKKDGDSPEQVYRSERIEYAAFTHIEDEGLASTFAASANQLVDTYRELNRAHQRGELDEGKAQAAIVAMSNTLEECLDAIELSSNA